VSVRLLKIKQHLLTFITARSALFSYFSSVLQSVLFIIFFFFQKTDLH